MTDFAALLQQGQGWLFFPIAIVLGALHGLEPGHSKTMMAAFIVAVRGTIPQAVLLGLAATVSHTAIVWLVAALGLYYGAEWAGTATEPYLHIIAGILMLVAAFWVMHRTSCEHKHRMEHAHGAEHAPHMPVYDDEHTRLHAEQLHKHLGGRHVTTGQIVLFGLTGGLLPCPGAITVLLLCLQVKQFALGMVLVACFSIGLAATLVASGVLAAWGTGHARKRWPAIDVFIAKAPYVSGAVIICLGLYMIVQGWQQLPA